MMNSMLRTMGVLVAPLLLSGCLATASGGGQRGVEINVGALADSLKTATTPRAVLEYRTAQRRNLNFVQLTQQTAKSGGLKEYKAEVRNVAFRDGMGRQFDVTAVAAYRIPIPTDALIELPTGSAQVDSTAKALASVFKEWNATDPIEVTVIGPDQESVDFLQSRIRNSSGLKVTHVISSEPGTHAVEIRMTSPRNEVRNATSN